MSWQLGKILPQGRHGLDRNIVANRPDRPFNVVVTQGKPMNVWKSGAAAAAVLCVLSIWAERPLAAGKPAPQARAPELQSVIACRALTDRDARLNCFDAATAKLDEAESTGQVVVVNREQARQVRRDVFGLQLPSLDVFGRKGAPGPGDDVEQLSSAVKTAFQNPDGRWVLELDTGAVWRQVDDSIVATPRPGSKVEIRRASLGSFFIRVDGHAGFRAHRDR